MSDIHIVLHQSHISMAQQNTKVFQNALMCAQLQCPMLRQIHHVLQLVHPHSTKLQEMIVLYKI